MRNLLQERSQIETISSDKKRAEAVSADEELSRFIFSSEYLNGNRTIIKAAAFMPNRTLKTSVFRKNRMLPDEYISKKIEIANLRNKELKAVGLIKVSSVLSTDLQVEPEESDHKWHADLTGWPESKHEQKNIAQVLAKAASIEY
ncbi:MAG: hypothetical protein Q8M57_07800 [Nitrosomonas sp.]|uniref:hypothetical protein n=1 Tax=Nitrosomonas sp. TaxID=42353 RepID=UPI00273442EA|nr:hypothetical protein [Nitrosomonas sp.]MDP3280934.1 hypothetical protein [Nitrosomonas sp.]